MISIKNKEYIKTSLNLMKVFFILTTFIFIASCDQGNHIVNNEVLTDENTENNKSEVNSIYKNYVEEAGFQTDTVENHGDYIRVEGDILLEKKDIRKRLGLDEKSETPQLQQAATYHIVQINPIVRNVRIEIDASVPTSWQNAIEEAANEWNSLSDVAININASSSINGDTKAMMDASLPYRTVAAAAFPTTDEEPGRTIRINPRYNNLLSSSQKKYNMVHEIGHLLGFRHTNWEDVDGDNAPSAYQLNFTPESDPNSVMNGETGDHSWQGFSEYDLNAAKVMYPDNLSVGNLNYQYVPYEVEVSFETFGNLYQYVYLQKYSNGSWTNFPEIQARLTDPFKFSIHQDRPVVDGTEVRVVLKSYRSGAYAASQPITLDF